MSSGYHEVSYDDGDEYKGGWNEEGMRHGFGKLNFADGTKYNGKFSEGLFNGNGSLTFPDGTKYEGEFVKGKYHGYGVYMRADGMKFEGQFVDGKVSGYGQVTFADGSCGRPRNEGKFDNNKCVKRCKAIDSIKKANQAVSTARTQST
eukprot:TRINITY_DN19705_c0_g1_i1.p1 TRINITY_DN19705_c0_g1~~TRINITY_DN19705_c0_g1_i1.p1  ORF type:complete len:148 (-),score=33.06 TRINITY_DN19705_c0_g1_i1:8-451(-)